MNFLPGEREEFLTSPSLKSVQVYFLKYYYLAKFSRYTVTQLVVMVIGCSCMYIK